MNFVALCTTKSAPSSSGFCSSGVANVLSTATRRTDCLRRTSDLRDVDHIQHGVAGGLQPHQVRLAHCLKEFALARHVHGAHAPAAPGRGAVLRQGTQTGVAVLRHDHPGTHRQQLQHGTDRSHPRREADRRTTLQVREQLLERLPPRRAVVAGVRPAPPTPLDTARKFEAGTMGTFSGCPGRPSPRPSTASRVSTRSCGAELPVSPLIARPPGLDKCSMLHLQGHRTEEVKGDASGGGQRADRRATSAASDRAGLDAGRAERAVWGQPQNVDQH